MARQRLASVVHYRAGRHLCHARLRAAYHPKDGRAGPGGGPLEGGDLGGQVVHPEHGVRVQDFHLSIQAAPAMTKQSPQLVEGAIGRTPTYKNVVAETFLRSKVGAGMCRCRRIPETEFDGEFAPLRERALAFDGSYHHLHRGGAHLVPWQANGG